MNEIKTAIIGNIRKSLGRGKLPDETRSRLRARMAESEQGIRPDFDQGLLERFLDKLERAAGTVTRVGSLDAVPEAVRAYLEEHQLRPNVVISRDEVMEHIGWPESWRIEGRPAGGDDHVSVTGAYVAIAETGTVAFLSGPGRPTTLNFLPDDHIVVIRADQIVSHLEDLWTLMRKRGEEMPRTVNLITGPSRTADVEQTIQLGAHGPRRFHVVLVDAS